MIFTFYYNLATAVKGSTGIESKTQAVSSASFACHIEANLPTYSLANINLESQLHIIYQGKYQTHILRQLSDSTGKMQNDRATLNQ